MQLVDDDNGQPTYSARFPVPRPRDNGQRVAVDELLRVIVAVTPAAYGARCGTSPRRTQGEP